MRYINLHLHYITLHYITLQHVLRCCERQSDGSEYKKTRWESLQRSRKPPSWWGGAGCPLPKNPIPRSRPFGPRLFYPHSEISSDAVEYKPLRTRSCTTVWRLSKTVLQYRSNSWNTTSNSKYRILPQTRLLTKTRRDAGDKQSVRQNIHSIPNVHVFLLPHQFLL